MPFASYPRGLRQGFPERSGARRRRRMLWLEALEERTVPSIIFNNASTATISDGGGLVLDQVHVELIFWGSGWDTGPGSALRSQTEAAVDSITSGPYLSHLRQYRDTIGSGFRAASVTIDSTDPLSVFSDSNVWNMLYANLSNGTLPDPASDPELLYMVIPQPGSTAGVGGQHSYLDFGGVRAHFGFTINPGDLDSITYYFSHELAESVSDPEGTAIQVNPSNSYSWNEICDGEAQNYSYRLNGYLVNSWFSQADHGYVVPTGQEQNFFVSSDRVLAVNGGQLSNPNNLITIGPANGIYTVTLNGEEAQFDSREFIRAVASISSITVNTGDGDDTVNIEGTLSRLPVTINLGAGTDTVNVSPTAQNLSSLAGTVTINGGSGSDALNLFDEGTDSNQSYTVTQSTVTRPNMATVSYYNVANVTLNTSNGADKITVQSTSGGTALAINGGSGVNTLVASAADNTWNITGSDTGTLTSAGIAGPVNFTSVQNLTGGAGRNTFVFSDSAGMSGNLDGGGGGSLDYSAYSSSVIADLQMGTATGVGGSIAHIQNVSGGTGGGAGVYNILVGNGGNILTGGNGRRNLLIAGSSASTLTSGDDDDILIGGTTAYDLDLASLMTIMDYWSGTSDDYATRVGNLLAGTGVPQLGPTTVTSNGGGNTLIGGPGLNLYYGNQTDATDFDPSSGAVFVSV
jgi:hypothetical protein